MTPKTSDAGVPPPGYLNDPRIYPEILMDAPIACFVSLPEGRIISANHAMARLLRYPSPDALIGAITNIGLQVYANPDDRARLLRDLTIRRELVDYECQWLRKNGQAFWVAVTLRAYPGTDNQDDAYIGFAVDITRRKQVEASLVDNDMKLQGIIQGSPIPAFVIDKHHHVLHWNKALEAMSGIPAAGIIGTDTHWQAFYSESRPCLGDLLVEGAEDMIPGWYGQQCVRSSLIAGAFEGTDFFPALGSGGKWLHFTAAPIKDAGGQIFGAIETLEDITHTKKAEQNLFEKQQQAEFEKNQWQITFDAMPDPVAVIDMDHRIMRINLAMANRLQATPENITGRHCYEVVHGSAAPPFFCPHTKTIAGGSTARAEVYEERMQGFFELTTTPIYNTDGRMVASVHVAHDITHRKYTEEALREKEAKFRALVEGMPDVVMRFDRDGRHLFVSENVEAVSGIPADAFIGRTHPEIGFDKDLCDYWHTAIQQVFDSGNSLETEFRLPAAAGEHIYDWRLVPQRDNSGNISSVLSISRDITDYRRTKQNYRDLFREMRNGFALHDIICDMGGNPVDYRFLAVNPAFERMVGLKSTDIVDRTVLDVLPGIEPYWIETFGAVALTGKPVFFEKYSTELHKYFEVSAFSPAPGQFACILADVTDQKKAETKEAHLQDKLVQAGKMEAVGRLAGGVAHDFNNMLGAILANAEVAMDELHHDSPAYECIHDIKEAAMRSALITRQLLAFSRKQRVSPKIIDLNQSIQKTLKILQTLIGDTIHLDWRPGSKLWPVRIDPSQVDQVLTNLCLNARDAVMANGRIVIETHNVSFDKESDDVLNVAVPGAYVMLAVRDDGAGMDTETLNRLFEPFFTTKAEEKGTGLGLSMVYGIIKQNSGFINIESEPGKGTCFQIYLPMIQSAIEPAERQSDKVLQIKGSETVLLVEDEPMILGAVRWHLNKLGYTVLAAELPEKALRMVDAYEGVIDLLITDVVMPEMSGLALAEQIQKRYSGIRCLFMSGYPGNVIARHGVLKESVHFIEKPFNMNHFATKVREVLETT